MPGGQPSDGGPSDAEAIERVRGGDREAFRILVERYQRRAYRLALRVLRDDEQARDAVQEGFLKAYASLHRFEGRSSFYTWLYRLVMNLCLDLKRRDRSGSHVEWDDGRCIESAEGVGPALGDPRGGGDHAPADAVLRKELRLQVGAAIEELPEGARETLLLREVDGLSYAEIAEALGVPKGTVMSRLHYARRRIRKLLGEQGLLDAEGSE